MALTAAVCAEAMWLSGLWDASVLLVSAIRTQQHSTTAPRNVADAQVTKLCQHDSCWPGILLAPGFVPTENLRFREEGLTFKVAEQDTKEEEIKKFLRYQYPAMKKTQVREVGHAVQALEPSTRGHPSVTSIPDA